MNTWLTIWTEPRATMREILGGTPQKDLIWIALVEGLYIGFGSMPQLVWISPPPQEVISPHNIWILAVLIPLLGGGVMLGLLYGGSYFVRWVGRWLGGQADLLQVRAAIVWGSVPSMASNAVGGFTDMLSPKALGSPDGLSMIAAAILGLLALVLTIWATIVSCKCLAEAQGFGAWRALFNYLISGVLLMLTCLLPVAVLGMIVISILR